MAQRSTITNLACFSHYTTNIVDKQGQVDAVYTDFSKAFDRIDHNLILNKLGTYFGFDDKTIKFFSSYLNNRQQSVHYSGQVSNNFTATSGVPQGSNLGPLLFLLFINDLSDVIDHNKLLYADDLKIFTSITSFKDCYDLQQDLNELQKWCVNNKLNLNINKCRIVTFTKKQSPILFPYSMNATPLTRQSSVRDLGVWFDSRLSFSQHVDYTVSAANKTLGLIIRTCKSFSSVRALKTLFLSLVRSKLEYAAIIWCPYYNIHQTRLENVQRKFLKFTSFIVEGTYPDRGFPQAVLLQKFELDSLNTRRKIIAITFLYKLLHNEIDCVSLLSAINFHIPRISTRSQSTFKCSLMKTNIMYLSPIHNMCTVYNAISELCDINFDSLHHIINKAKTNCQ